MSPECARSEMCMVWGGRRLGKAFPGMSSKAGGGASIHYSSGHGKELHKQLHAQSLEAMFSATSEGGCHAGQVLAQCISAGSITSHISLHLHS